MGAAILRRWGRVFDPQFLCKINRVRVECHCGSLRGCAWARMMHWSISVHGLMVPKVIGRQHDGLLHSRTSDSLEKIDIRSVRAESRLKAAYL